MNQYAHDHNIFVGLSNLKDDTDIINTQIPLSKLRYLISTTLNLHPFLKVIELHLAKIISQFNFKE